MSSSSAWHLLIMVSWGFSSWHASSVCPPQDLPTKQPKEQFLAFCSKRALLQMDFKLSGSSLAALLVLFLLQERGEGTDKAKEQVRLHAVDNCTYSPSLIESNAANYLKKNVQTFPSRFTLLVHMPYSCPPRQLRSTKAILVLFAQSVLISGSIES